jgi:hypothetical protein
MRLESSGSREIEIQSALSQPSFDIAAMKVESFQAEGWEEPEMGLIITENDEWILVKHLPAEYVVDGYKLYRKRFLKSRMAGEDEKKVARVLQLKKVDVTAPAGFKLGPVLDMLRWIEGHFGLFELQDQEESELYYGRIHKESDGLVILEMIDADGHGEVDEDYDHVLEQIATIAFGSDYLYSLNLLWKDNLSSNGSG